MLNIIYYLYWRLKLSKEYPGIQLFFKDILTEKSMSDLEWRNKQLNRLQNILIFASEQVPFYRKLFNEIEFKPNKSNFENDFTKIPILTKSIIKKNQDELVSESINKSNLIKNMTGGSTGVPLVFFQDKKYSTIAKAIDLYIRHWWQIKSNARTAIIWGADREFHNLSLKERLYFWLQRIKSLNAFRMDQDNLHEFCTKISKWNPDYLVGYSSALETLANFVVQNDYRFNKFSAIRSSAEMLWPNQRKLIEDTFNSPVYNFYGSREVNNLAAECPEERNLHFISTWRYVEITDKDGRCLPSGELGYITVTDLSNYAMPFIRYRNEDMGVISPNKCECGRPSTILHKLVGRSSDLIRTSTGEIIHGEYFTHLFYGVNWIKQFQIHQKDINMIIIKYVIDGIVEKSFFDKIKSKIVDKMGPATQVVFKECTEIPIPKSGKHRFTISDLNLKMEN